MGFIKKILKWIGYSLLIMVALGVLGLGVFAYKRHQELTYKAREEVWEWRNWISWVDGVQTLNTEKSPGAFGDIPLPSLRQVYPSQDYEVRAWMDSDYRVSMMARFSVKCEPDSIIETTKTWSGGSPKTLHCNRAGDTLSFSSAFKEASYYGYIWNDDLDGFSINTFFEERDFALIKREILLNKAKPRDPNAP